MSEVNIKGDMGGGREKTLKVNYSANSHKSKNKEAEPEKKERRVVEQITVGTVSSRKKPMGRKLVETFIRDDLHSVGSHVLFEVIIPAAKSMLSDVTREGVDRMLYGGVKSSGARSGKSGAHISYNRMYTKGAEVVTGNRDISNKARATHDFEEIVLETRGEAEKVLERLGDLIRDYDVATVSDLYSLVGITGSFTDDKWGWYSLRDADVRAIRKGYLLVLPKTEPLD